MNKKISKRILALVLSGMLVVPMVGCESEFSLFSISSKDKTQVEEFNKFDKQTTHTDEEAVNAIITGHYNVRYDGQDYTVPMTDVLNTLFPDYEIFTQSYDENTWLVKFQSGDNYIIYRMSFLDGTLVEQGLKYDGILLTEVDDKAKRGILELIVRDIIDPEISTSKEEKKEDKKEEKSLTCKQCGKSYKKSKSDATEPDKYCSSGCNTEASMLEKKKKEEEAEKKEASKATCQWCGDKYNPKDSNAWEPERFCCKSCHAAYEESQQAQYKYYCAYCGAGFRPDSSDADDPYSFCNSGCEYQWYYEQNPGEESDYIDHNPCRGCGKEIGLNGGEGYCHDCNEARYNNR